MNKYEDVGVILVFAGLAIGIIDGLTEDIMLEAFLWADVLGIAIVLIILQLVKSNMLRLGLILVFLGAFAGILQIVFYLVYSVMRQIPLYKAIWLFPEVVVPISVFWSSIVLGLISLAIGFYMLHRHGGELE